MGSGFHTKFTNGVGWIFSYNDLVDVHVIRIMWHGMMGIIGTGCEDGGWSLDISVIHKLCTFMIRFLCFPVPGTRDQRRIIHRV